MTDKITAYKGFNEKLQGHGDFQFEVGKTYTHTGSVKACGSGFHASENPFDVLEFYPNDDGKRRYAVVEQSGEFSKQENKNASQVISIKEEISFSALLSAGFKFTFSKVVELMVSASVECKKSVNSTAGDSSHSNTAGDSSHSNTAGDRSHSNTAGYSSHSNTAGDSSHSNTAGYSSHSNTAGYRSHSNTAGDRSHSTAMGKNSIASAMGYESHVKGADGNILILIHYKFVEGNYIPQKAVSEVVGKNKIKSDTWYTLNTKGQFKEVK